MSLARPLAALAAGLLVGCSDRPPPRTEVSGAVTLGAAPVTGGIVTLLGPDGREASGAIRPDGSYAVADPPAGTCQVTVKGPPPAPVLPKGLGAPHDPPPASGGVLAVKIPARYARPGNGLSVEVKAGPQVYNVALTP